MHFYFLRLESKKGSSSSSKTEREYRIQREVKAEEVKLQLRLDSGQLTIWQQSLSPSAVGSIKRHHCFPFETTDVHPLDITVTAALQSII